MATNIITKKIPTLHRVIWFVVLWCGGVLAAALLALPFKLLILAVTI
jgi:hypothetical protein